MSFSANLAFWGVGAGLVALCYAAYLLSSLLKESMGNDRMKELSDAIHGGAMAFLNRQYKTLIPFAVIIFVLLLFASGVAQGISFLVEHR